MNQIIQESWDYHKKLSQFMTKSASHVDILKTYLNNIQAAHEDFAKSIKESSEKFYHDISQEAIDNEILLFSYNYLCHFILNISHQFMSSSGDIQNRILEPFELFCENFKETNNNLLKNGNKLIEGLENAKMDLLKKQEKYYKSAKEAEKYSKTNEKHIMKFDVSKKIEDVNNYTYEALNRQATVERTTEEYKTSIVFRNILNKRWENYDFEFYTIFDNFDLNEESRIHFTKLNVSQMIKALAEVYESIGGSMKDYNAQSFETRSKSVEENVSSNKVSSKEILKDLDISKNLRNARREEFVSYEMWKKVKGDKKISTNNKENVSDEKTSLISEKMMIDNFINSLIREKNKAMMPSDSANTSTLSNSTSFNIDSSSSTIGDDCTDFEEDSKLLDILKNSPSMRRYYLEKACSQTKFSRDNPIPVEKWRSLINITAIILDSLSEPEEKEYEFFYYLMSYLIKFYKDSDRMKKKRYLGSVFKSHHLFTELVRWENLTYYLFHRKKLEEYQKNIEVEKADEASDEKKGIISTFRNKIQGYLDTNKPVTVDEPALKLSVVDEINVYLLHLELEHRLASKILLDVSKKVGIDYESRNMLSTILERKNNSEIHRNTKSKSLIHMRRQNKLGKMHAIWLALDFLSYKDDLLSILLVSKEWNNKLQRKVYQLALSSPDEKLSLKKRILVWTSILKIDKFDLDYFKVKEKYNLLEQNVFPVEDIITLDVQRSFHNHPQINTMILYNLLRIYAHYNEKVSYCQGMNYIMGFIYCLFREEDKTFKFFVTLIDKYMRVIFEEDLETLKAIFYKFDRLMAIFIPDLADHFKKESIESSLFSASWFITLFTNVFQHSSNSYTLLRVWDIFLLEGWKGFYKICLWVMEVNKEKLLKLRFDTILGFLNEIVRDEIFTNFIYHQGILSIQKGEKVDPNLISSDVLIRNFPKSIQKYNISSDLLDALHEDFVIVETEAKELKKQMVRK